MIAVRCLIIKHQREPSVAKFRHRAYKVIRDFALSFSHGRSGSGLVSMQCNLVCVLTGKDRAELPHLGLTSHQGLLDDESEHEGSGIIDEQQSASAAAPTTLSSRPGDDKGQEEGEMGLKRYRETIAARDRLQDAFYAIDEALVLCESLLESFPALDHEQLMPVLAFGDTMTGETPSRGTPENSLKKSRMALEKSRVAREKSRRQKILKRAGVLDEEDGSDPCRAGILRRDDVMPWADVSPHPGLQRARALLSTPLVQQAAASADLFLSVRHCVRELQRLNPVTEQHIQTRQQLQTQIEEVMAMHLNSGDFLAEEDGNSKRRVASKIAFEAFFLGGAITHDA